MLYLSCTTITSEDHARYEVVGLLGNTIKDYLDMDPVSVVVFFCIPICLTMAMNPSVSRWVHKPENLCTGKHTLTKCPNTATDKLFREHVCLHFSVEQSNATTQMFYHCQYDERLKTYHEFMAESHKCPKGQFGKVQMKYNVVRIVCTLCPDDSYEPESTTSPSNLKGCHYKRHEVHPSEHLLLYKKGTPSSPDTYYCDYLNGYYSEFHDLFCDFHAPCRCRNNEKCSSCRGQLVELLPDGTCHSKCGFARLPENGFMCIVPGVSGPLAYHSDEEIEVVNVGTVPKICRAVENRNDTNPALIITITIVVIIVIILAAYVGRYGWLHYSRHRRDEYNFNRGYCIFCLLRRICTSLQ